MTILILVLLSTNDHVSDHMVCSIKKFFMTFQAYVVQYIYIFEQHSRKFPKMQKKRLWLFFDLEMVKQRIKSYWALLRVDL